MKMQMLYCLSAVLTAVIDDAETLFQLQIFRQFGGNLINMGDDTAVLRRDLQSGTDVFLGMIRIWVGALGSRS